MDAQWPVSGGLDAVLCRNVSIYFDRPTQQAVFDRMCDLLVPEGHLIVGHSEVLHFMTNRLEALHGSIYRLRPGATGRRATPTVPARASNLRLVPAPRATPATTPTTTSRIHAGEFAVGGEGTVVSTLLGSCVAACLWDPIAKIGGMNHFLLPDGEGDHRTAARYGVHAMELLINAIMVRGGDRRRLKAKLFGGGAVLEQEPFEVGEKNVRFARDFLTREGITLEAHQLGGREGREVRFDAATGRAWVRPIPRQRAPATPRPPPLRETEPSLF
jgi:chemotaxis receptor (MCP) glutamine deamidase CheD